MIDGLPKDFKVDGDNAQEQKAPGTHGRGDGRERDDGRDAIVPDPGVVDGRGSSGWGSEGAGGASADRASSRDENKE